MHIVTVNDYLAQYQWSRWGACTTSSVWMSGYPVPMSPAERRRAYGTDITYGTNNEFG